MGIDRFSVSEVFKGSSCSTRWSCCENMLEYISAQKINILDPE